MGGRIIHLRAQSTDVELTAAFERPDHPSVGSDAGQVAGLGNLGIKVAGSLKEVIGLGEVIIDFTAPEATLDNLRLASTANLAVVIGTTGMSGSSLDQVKALARSTRCVLSPNMSVWSECGCSRLPGKWQRFWEKTMTWRSSSAPPVQERCAKRHCHTPCSDPGLRHEPGSRRRCGLPEKGYDRRKDVQGDRNTNLRAGDITGEHTILFGGIGERLELIHRAHNRDNFARGAVKAAAWVVQQPVGLYDMQDVLGLSEQ
jgi:4-hydroxy-tetrahydrodipicolinate reductase